jgi:hypothetical protein
MPGKRPAVIKPSPTKEEAGAKLMSVKVKQVQNKCEAAAKQLPNKRRRSNA